MRLRAGTYYVSMDCRYANNIHEGTPQSQDKSCQPGDYIIQQSRQDLSIQ